MSEKMTGKQLGDSPITPHTMSLRQHFAGLAMQGLLTDRDEAGVLVEKGYVWIADQAVKCADALLDALCEERT